MSERVNHWMNEQRVDRLVDLVADFSVRQRKLESTILACSFLLYT